MQAIKVCKPSSQEESEKDDPQMREAKPQISKGGYDRTLGYGMVRIWYYNIRIPQGSQGPPKITNSLVERHPSWKCRKPTPQCARCQLKKVAHTGKTLQVAQVTCIAGCKLPTKSRQQCPFLSSPATCGAPTVRMV